MSRCGRIERFNRPWSEQRRGRKNGEPCRPAAQRCVECVPACWVRQTFRAGWLVRMAAGWRCGWWPDEAQGVCCLRWPGVGGGELQLSTGEVEFFEARCGGVRLGVLARGHFHRARMRDQCSSVRVRQPWSFEPPAAGSDRAGNRGRRRVWSCRAWMRGPGHRASGDARTRLAHPSWPAVRPLLLSPMRKRGVLPIQVVGTTTCRSRGESTRPRNWQVLIKVCRAGASRPGRMTSAVLTCLDSLLNPTDELWPRW